MTDFERRHLLDRDEPGAPPGYLLDRDDERSHERLPSLGSDVEIEVNPLAQGEGEEED